MGPVVTGRPPSTQAGVLSVTEWASMLREFIQPAAVLLRLPLAQIAYTGRPAVSPPHRAGAVRSGICRRPMRVRTRTALPPLR